MAAKKKIEKSNIDEDTKVTPECSEKSDTRPNEKTKYKVKSELDPNMIVTVINGFSGTLVYQSKKTGEVFRWEEFGDEQEMELSELKNAKNSYKKFFENNWFLIEDQEVIDYLGVSKFYKNTLSLDGFDDLFNMPINDMVDIIKNLPYGQKRTLTYRAKQMIKDEKIDSIKMITALEQALNIELIER